MTNPTRTQDELEQLIDNNDLETVLYAIAEICRKKAGSALPQDDTLTSHNSALNEHSIWNDIASRVEFLSDQLPQLPPRLISDTRSE
jgi:hypothetical protein